MTILVCRGAPKNTLMQFGNDLPDALMPYRCEPQSKIKQRNGDGLLVAKGYNGRVIVAWVASCLVDALQNFPDHEILLLATNCMLLGTINLNLWPPYSTFFHLECLRVTCNALQNYVMHMRMKSHQFAQDIIGKILLADGAEWTHPDTCLD